MTDQKRDESRDMFVNEPHFRISTDQSRPTRYVPHSDLVAAEQRAEKYREALTMLLEEINAAPLAIHGGQRDIDRFEAALRVARELAK